MWRGHQILEHQDRIQARHWQCGPFAVADSLILCCDVPPPTPGRDGLSTGPAFKFAGVTQADSGLNSEFPSDSESLIVTTSYRQYEFHKIPSQVKDSEDWRSARGVSDSDSDPVIVNLCS